MPQEIQTQPGLIHVYCGEGKGKSTAAIGLIVRAAGHGRRTMLVQFLKNGHSGELMPLRQLAGTRILTGRPFTAFSYEMKPAEREETLDLHIRQMGEAILAANSGEIDLLVLDEACGAIGAGLLPEEMVLDFLRRKPAALEVVLTGRGPTTAILELADYISEICCIRHPFQKGVSGREGIEY
jgi:cob(I)alamin adenosyltransferase